MGLCGRASPSTMSGCSHRGGQVGVAASIPREVLKHTSASTTCPARGGVTGGCSCPADSVGEPVVQALAKELMSASNTSTS
jgi:hypothetical protein